MCPEATLTKVSYTINSCLNPCCNGMCPEDVDPLAIQHLYRVLILVVMECVRKFLEGRIEGLNKQVLILVVMECVRKVLFIGILLVLAF